MFRKATRKQVKLRMGLVGPSGSGKTYTALRIAHALADGGLVAVIDTERGSACRYADAPNPDGGRFDFVVADLEKFSPQDYTRAIRAAEDAGAAVLVIDSISHAWEGEGGVMDLIGIIGYYDIASMALITQRAKAQPVAEAPLLPLTR